MGLKTMTSILGGLNVLVQFDAIGAAILGTTL